MNKLFTAMYTLTGQLWPQSKEEAMSNLFDLLGAMLPG